MRTVDLAKAPSGYMLMQFKVEADFPVVIMHNGTRPRYSTPGMGENGASVEFRTGQHSPYAPGPGHLIWIGGLARTGWGYGGMADGPTGNFKLSWDYSTIPTIGGPDEAAAFFNPVEGYVRYIDRLVMPPFNATANFDNFEAGAKYWFKRIAGQDLGQDLDAGTYLLVFAGGCISIDQTGFVNPTQDTGFSASPEEAIISGPFIDYTHATLYWNNGSDSEPLPFDTWSKTDFLPSWDIPNAKHFTKWAMRYYWKVINHTGGKMWVSADGCVGFSDTNSQHLGDYDYTVAGKLRQFSEYAADPKFFLFKVGTPP
jgi:hypothetical protein